MFGLNELNTGFITGLNVKIFEEESLPAVFMTLILPVEPLPTIAVIVESLFVNENEAASVLPNLTEVTPVKLYPSIITFVPVVPNVGLKFIRLGVCSINVKIVLEVSLPALLETLITPVDPPPTLACIVESLMIANVNASLFPNFTDEIFTKLFPLIVTRVPMVPELGENDLKTGFETAVVNVKFVFEVSLPPLLVTIIIPVEPVPTVACIVESLLIVKDDASVFPNFTDDTHVKLFPLNVT